RSGCSRPRASNNRAAKVNGGTALALSRFVAAQRAGRVQGEADLEPGGRPVRLPSKCSIPIDMPFRGGGGLLPFLLIGVHAQIVARCPPERCRRLFGVRSS